MTKAVASLSHCDLAAMYQILALHSRFRSAAVASTDAYEAVDTIFEDVRTKRQRAKEHKERCAEEYVKFKAYADKLMSSSAQIIGSQFAASWGQQVQGKNFTLVCQC